MKQKEQFERMFIYGDSPMFNGIVGLNFSDLTSTSSKYTIREVEDAIENNDRSLLIEMSNYFFVTHGEYRNLIFRLANTNIYRYVVSPIKNYQKESLQDYNRQYQAIMEYSLKTDIENICNDIDFYVLRDGGFYGYERELGKEIVLQQLPAQYCRSRYRDHNSNYAIEFNFKFFDDNYKNADERFEIFEQMPEEFEQLYNEYKSAGSVRGSEWKLLDMTKTRCHMLTEDGIPFFSSVFIDLIKHLEYKEIDLLKSKQDLYKVLTQKIPLKDGKPTVSEDEFQDLHRGAKSMIGGEGIDVLTTMCETEAVDLSDKSEKSSTFIENGLNNIYNSTSTSRFLFNSGATPSTTGIDKNIKSLEAMLRPLLLQHQNWYNTRFQAITGTQVTMVLTFLGITIWNEEKRVDMLKEQAMTSGSKLAYFSGVGINQFVLDSLAEFENDYLGLLDKLKPLPTAYTQSGTEENDDEGGRPKGDVDEIEDVTTEQREDGTTEDRGNSDG